MQGGSKPNAEEARWMEEVRELGSIISDAPALIHHPVGTTGKHNKKPIGHKWLIPLTDAEHRLIDTDFHAFAELMLGKPTDLYSRWDPEKLGFARVCQRLGKYPPGGKEIYETIMDYKR